jgi:alcohol dehydrogenase
MMLPIRFYLKTELIAGIGVYKDLPAFLADKCKNPLLIVDENIAEIPPVAFLREELLQGKFQGDLIVTRGSEEPDYDYLDSVTDQAHSMAPDLVVGIGGGSTLDLAKAVAVLLTNPGKGLDYRGFDKAECPGVPLMAIPTTAGTASEVTVNAVFTDKAEKRKLGINGKSIESTWAVLDPHFTRSAPFSVAVSSGVDAMVHVLESFVTSNAPVTNYSFTQRQNSNPVTKSFAREAFSLLYHNLPALVEDPGNMSRLLNIQLGAYYAGISLFNTGSGIAGAMSYPLGVHYKVPHGIGGGMFALPVVQYNVANGFYDYQFLYDLIEDADLSLDPKAKCDHFLQLMEELFGSLKVPKSLSSFGIEADCYEHVLEIMQGLQGAFDQNPVSLKVEDAGILLKPFFN